METEIQKENEEKKEYLKSYRRAVKREKDILDEIQRLRADKMFPAVANDGMPKGSNQSDLSDYRQNERRALGMIRVLFAVEEE